MQRSPMITGNHEMRAGTYENENAIGDEPRQPVRRRPTLSGRLARALILSVGGVWLLSVLGVAWYVDREIDFNFDNELVEAAHRMMDVALEHYDAQPSDAPRPLPARRPLFQEDELIYQLVDASGHVLLRSSAATPDMFDVPLVTGFYDLPEWRVYTARHPTLELYFQAVDPLQERRAAVNRTLIGLIVSMIAVLPLLAILLRAVARRQLGGLQRLSDEIAHRGGGNLRAIVLPQLPRELDMVATHVNRLLDRLAHALDVERALAANAAHELRTPLAAARIRLQTALDHDLDRTQVQAALVALDELGHRAEKLLQLSRAESGAAFANASVDVLQLAKAVSGEYWQDEKTAARFDLRIPATPVANAHGDIDALAIALRNLIENALRYSDGAAVTLEVRAPCTLVVRDAGPGVTPQVLQTLRQRHVRHSADSAGYGLGLSIVATIAQRQGARLMLASPSPGCMRGFEAQLVLSPADSGPADRPGRLPSDRPLGQRQ